MPTPSSFPNAPHDTNTHVSEFDLLSTLLVREMCIPERGGGGVIKREREINNDVV